MFSTHEIVHESTIRYFSWFRTLILTFIDSTQIHHSADFTKCTEGVRIPHVYLHANTTKLHICTALNGNFNHVWNSEEMPVNTWFKLTIKQTRFQAVNEIEVRSKFIYEILINDEIMHQAINQSPKTFRNVNGYSGTTGTRQLEATIFGGDPQFLFAAGQFRNFTFKSEPD